MATTNHPAAALQHQIAAELCARGHANADIDDLPVTVEMWRRIARAAAREIGRPVQTLLVGRSSVTAVLRDWPASDEERAIRDTAMRAAMSKVPIIVVPAASGRRSPSVQPDRDG